MQKLVFWSAAVCCLTDLSFEKVQRHKIVSHDRLMMTLERRRDLMTVLEPYFLPKRLHSTKSYFIKAIDHTFYGFTGVITHLGCWENTRKACKSRAEAGFSNYLASYLFIVNWTFVLSLQKLWSIHEFVGDAWPKRHMSHSTEIQPSHPREVKVGSFDDTLALGSRWLN